MRRLLLKDPPQRKYATVHIDGTVVPTVTLQEIRLDLQEVLETNRS